MAEATGQAGTTTEAVDRAAVDGAKCPFAHVNTLEDVSRLLRSKTAVTHSPDLFASRASDEVNGEINVREFLAASMMYTEGDSHRLRRKLLNPLVRAASAGWT
jgi:cytochrome P450